MSSPIPLAEMVRRFAHKARLSHAENPDRPGYALCGFNLTHARPVSAETHKCVVCLDLSQRRFTDR